GAGEGPRPGARVLDRELELEPRATHLDHQVEREGVAPAVADVTRTRQAELRPGARPVLAAAHRRPHLVAREAVLGQRPAAELGPADRHAALVRALPDRRVGRGEELLDAAGGD